MTTGELKDALHFWYYHCDYRAGKKDKDKEAFHIIMGLINRTTGSRLVPVVTIEEMVKYVESVSLIRHRYDLTPEKHLAIHNAILDLIRGHGETDSIPESWSKHGRTVNCQCTLVPVVSIEELKEIEPK